MIISVWNQDDRDLSKAFTTLLASVATLLYPTKITVLENSMSGRLIGDMMLGNTYSEELREDGARFYEKGAGGSIVPYIESRYLKSGRMKNLVEIVERGLYYIPQYNDGSKVVFDLDFYDRMFEYKEQAQKISDHLIIATARNDSFTTPHVLEAADKVVVLIPFNALNISRFLDNYRSIRSKCIMVYLIHEDLIKNRENANRLMRNYGFRKNEYYIIGYTDQMEYSEVRGKILDYIRENLEHRHPEEQAFLNSLRRLCEEIFGKKELGMGYRSSTINDVLKKRDPES